MLDHIQRKQNVIEDGIKLHIFYLLLGLASIILVSGCKSNPETSSQSAKASVSKNSQETMLKILNEFAMKYEIVRSITPF